MMAPFDTNLLKHSAQRHQLPTEAERAAARLTPGPRQFSRRIISCWSALTNLFTLQSKLADT
ncbi:MAG: hypothetical protein AB3N21_19355 [Ruegeria sp.]|uniref:hypothetical protein n=1 Tax=Ruegeria sp. TaxID=1879320 RepID=UPI00349E8801